MGADKSLAFPIFSSTKRSFLGWVKEVATTNVSRPSFEPLYAINTYHRKQETFLYAYPLH
jgi:hypothetical protein